MEEVLLLLFVWLVMGVIVGLIGKHKGSSGCGWFLFGLLIWPIALVAVLLVQPTAEAEDRKSQRQGRVPCPYCAEYIRPEAAICPYCRKEVPLLLVPENDRRDPTLPILLLVLFLIAVAYFGLFGPSTW